MLVKTTNKWTAAKAVINTMLKDKKRICNNCGVEYLPGLDCCSDPQVGTRADILKGVIEQNKMIRSSRRTETASDKSKSIRYGISMPPWLYDALVTYFRNHGEKFLSTKKEMHDFMRNFPQLCIPREV